MFPEFLRIIIIFMSTSSFKSIMVMATKFKISEKVGYVGRKSNKSA